MPTLPNMSLITPTAGADSGTWDDKINAAFALVDAHDHTSGKGVTVPVSGLNINADFAMGGYAVTGLGSIAFNAVTALTTGSKRLFVGSSDNELYWRTNAGTNVKLTSGTSINTSLVGGIVGDYSTVGAEVAYDDANDRYTFKDQTSPSKFWARLASGPVRIYEFGTVESVYVEHAVAAALASSYTVTWPAALPATSTPVQISATGVVSFPSQVGKTKVIGAAEFAIEGTSHAFVYTGTVNLGTSTTDRVVIPIPLSPGDVLTDVVLRLYKASNAANTIFATIYKVAADLTRTAIESNATTANAPGNTTLTVTSSPVTETIADTHHYQVEIYHGAAVAGDSLRSLVVTYNKAL